MVQHPQRFRWKLAVILYPFVWAAVAINLFMLSLLWQAFGMSALSPILTMIIATPIALPINFLCLRWVKSLIEQAETQA